MTAIPVRVTKVSDAVISPVWAAVRRLANRRQTGGVVYPNAFRHDIEMAVRAEVRADFSPREVVDALDVLVSQGKIEFVQDGELDLYALMLV